MSERRSNSGSGKIRSGEAVGDEIDFIPRYRAPLLVPSPPPKTTIAAITLLLGGILFLSLGASFMWSHAFSHGKDRGLPLLILGSISKCSYFIS